MVRGNELKETCEEGKIGRRGNWLRGKKRIEKREREEGN